MGYFTTLLLQSTAAPSVLIGHILQTSATKLIWGKEMYQLLLKRNRALKERHSQFLVLISSIKFQCSFPRMTKHSGGLGTVKIHLLCFLHYQGKWWDTASHLPYGPLSRKLQENRADLCAAVCTKHLDRLKVWEACVQAKKSNVFARPTGPGHPGQVTEGL